MGSIKNFHVGQHAMPGLMCSEAGISGCMAEVVDDGAGEAKRDQCLDGVYCLFFGIGLAEEAEFGAASGKRSRLHRPHAYFEVLQGDAFLYGPHDGPRSVCVACWAVRGRTAPFLPRIISLSTEFCKWENSERQKKTASMAGAASYISLHRAQPFYTLRLARRKMYV